MLSIPETGLRATDSRRRPEARGPGARSLLRERSERRKDLGVVRLVPGVLEDLAVAHAAVLVDHEHGALRDALQADHVLIEHAVVPNHLFVEVGQEREGELFVVVKGLERKEGVNAQAKHLGFYCIEL